MAERTLEQIPEEPEDSVGEISDPENVPEPETRPEVPMNAEAPEFYPAQSSQTHPGVELLKIGGRIKVPVKVNGTIVVKALMDSGAEPSCISQSLADKLGLKPDSETTFLVQGVGEDNVHTGKEVSGIVIGLHGLKFKPNKFIIIENAGTDYDVVLGLNWLISNEVAINPGERTIFHRKDDRLEWLVEVAKDERYRVLEAQLFWSGTNIATTEEKPKPMQTAPPLLPEDFPRGLPFFRRVGTCPPGCPCYFC